MDDIINICIRYNIDYYYCIRNTYCHYLDNASDTEYFRYDWRLFSSHTVLAQEDDIILVRTEPDPTSQELSCADQIIVYECQQLIPSSDLTWTLPNNEILRISQSRDINDIEPSDDDKYIATLTNKIEGEETDTFLFTSTLMILEPVNVSTVTCTGGTTPQVSNDITIILSGRSLLCV